MGYVPPGASRADRGARRGAVIFAVRNYKNYVSSVEVGMGMEGQIMCVEQCTFKTSPVAFLGPQSAPKLLSAEASFQTTLQELTALPRPIAWFRTAYF